MCGLNCNRKKISYTDSTQLCKYQGFYEFQNLNLYLQCFTKRKSNNIFTYRTWDGVAGWGGGGNEMMNNYVTIGDTEDIRTGRVS